MTGLSARNFGLTDRGVLTEGAFADLALFDPATVDAGSTYESPLERAKGIDTVIVNGRIVWRDGQSAGEHPGRVLRRLS
jgi:N-acyl-D-amino-acid deacylase